MEPWESRSEREREKDKRRTVDQLDLRVVEKEESKMAGSELRSLGDPVHKPRSIGREGRLGERTLWFCGDKGIESPSFLAARDTDQQWH
jgi:hypothetical protein